MSDHADVPVNPCASAHFFPGHGSFSARMDRADRGDRIGEICACGQTRIVSLGPFGAINRTTRLTPNAVVMSRGGSDG